MKNLPPFKTIGIATGKPFNNYKILQDIVKIVQQLGLQTILEKETFKDYNFDGKRVGKDELKTTADLVIVLGGDGSFLRIAKFLLGKVGIIGVNLGQFGFLSDILPLNLSHELREILLGNYIIENRFLLDAQIDNSPPLLAINEVLFTAENATKILDFEVHIDNHFLSSYKANGLVVATPTGSTALSLSIGGTIISPEVDVVSLMAISSHSLFNRPFIISANHEIRIKLGSKNRNRALCYTDCHDFFVVNNNQEVVIKKNKKSLTLIHPKNYNYYDVLRKKIGLGSIN